MRKAIVVVAALWLSLIVLCGCLFTAAVVADFWRYGVPAMEEWRREPNSNQPDEASPSQAQSGTPQGSTQLGSDKLVRKHNCQACHGPQLRGQQLGVLHAPDLTPSGVAGRWSEAEFMTAMRTGNRPDGSQLPDAMPWRAIGKASDEELEQLWAYLKSLP